MKTMRFFRLFLYGAIAVASVTIWELCREDLVRLRNSDSLDKTVVIGHQEDIKSPNKETVSKEADFIDKKEKKQEGKIDLNFQKGFSDIVKRAMCSVVNVATMQVVKDEDPADIAGGLFKGDPFEGFFKDFFGERAPIEKKERKAHTLGSGFIVRVDKNNNKAYVVTNNHVIDKAKKIVLYLYDKAELPAEIHAVDQRTDIAVLVVDTKILGDKVDLLTPIAWGDSDLVEEGNWIIAIGNPFGLGCTVTNGIVSSKGRDLPIPGKSSLNFVDDFIQHNAQINSGSSGGCLLNIIGEVVGVNNAILSIAGGNIGISFAIPSNIIKNAVDQLIDHKRTFRGWLGAEVQNVMAKQAESVGIDVGKNLNPTKVFAAFVVKVTPGSPAEKAGIKRGDIIIEFNGQKIADKGGLTKIVGATKIDSKVKAKIWRQTEGKGWNEVDLDITVGDFEKGLELSKNSDSFSKKDETPGEQKEEEILELGITISKIPEKMRSAVQDEFANNILVTKVDEMNSMSFFDSLFLPGDIIVSVNNVKVTSISQFKKTLDDLKKSNRKEKPVPFVIIRGGSMVMLATTINFEKDDKEVKNKK